MCCVTFMIHENYHRIQLSHGKESKWQKEGQIQFILSKKKKKKVFSLPTSNQGKEITRKGELQEVLLESTIENSWAFLLGTECSRTAFPQMVLFWEWTKVHTLKYIKTLKKTHFQQLYIKIIIIIIIANIDYVKMWCKIPNVTKLLNLSINLILQFNLNDLKHFIVFKLKWESQIINFTISSVRCVEIEIPSTQFKNKIKFSFDKVSLSKRKPHQFNKSLEMCGLLKTWC